MYRLSVAFAIDLSHAGCWANMASGGHVYIASRPALVPWWVPAVCVRKSTGDMDVVLPRRYHLHVSMPYEWELLTSGKEIASKACLPQQRRERVVDLT